MKSSAIFNEATLPRLVSASLVSRNNCWIYRCLVPVCVRMLDKSGLNTDQIICCLQTFVKLQNLSWYKTGFVSRQVLHLLSKLQTWICLKTGQYKTCIVSNTKFEASIRATKPKPWQSHIASETVKICIQNEKAGLGSAQSRSWCGRFSICAKPVLVQQV